MLFFPTLYFACLNVDIMILSCVFDGCRSTTGLHLRADTNIAERLSASLSCSATAQIRLYDGYESAYGDCQSSSRLSVFPARTRRIWQLLLQIGVCPGCLANEPGSLVTWSACWILTWKSGVRSLPRPSFALPQLAPANSWTRGGRSTLVSSEPS